MVLPSGDAPHLGKMLDIVMLAIADRNALNRNTMNCSTKRDSS